MSSRTLCGLCLRSLRRQMRGASSTQSPKTLGIYYQCFSSYNSNLSAKISTNSLNKAKSPPNPPAWNPKPPPKKDTAGPIVTKSSPETPTDKIAQSIRSHAPGFAETYVAYGACEDLVRECARAADYQMPLVEDPKAGIPKNEKGEDIGVGKGWWYKKLGLTPTFNTWAQITFLHMYLLTVRLRCFPAEHVKSWHQHLTDHFFFLAEERMTTMHGIHSKMNRTKYLKDLHEQWRGLTVAYDLGLVEGDAMLATAVWRNICKGDEDVDLRRLAEIVSYMRSVLFSLDKMSDESIATADIVFEDPGNESSLVAKKSPLMFADELQPAAIEHEKVAASAAKA